MTTVESEDFKSYEPLFPCQNKKIQESLDKSTFKKHRKAVDSASTVLDTKQPRVYIHQHLKLKKLQIEEERLATIERDNRLLLERIAKIMRTTGSIDNNNMDREMKRFDQTLQTRHNLSIERRQRELLRITQENKRILSQIMARKTKSDYSRTNWEPKWKKEEYYMAQLSRFQPVTRKIELLFQTKKTEGEDDGDEQGEGRAKKESNGQELEQQKAD
ncbi:sperm axonemal maintenance protein CFAP97D1-like isoform X3 [Convolutriloba macropyga]|uniref:sperm axonemal maintenance protein CFAP97D1-like isoform X3 n=1 Tax=Convolutriloba macropyga TaxID=536237 RepID=UPI003F5274BE